MILNSSSNSTSASSSEFKRLILIGIQIRSLFDELTDESETVKNKYQDMVEKKYIKAFKFHAIKSGKSYAELEVAIDWGEHQRQLDNGHLIIKTRSRNGILSPTHNVAKRFREYSDNNGFKIVWVFTYADHVNIAEAQKRYNTSVATPIEPADLDSNYVSREFPAGDLTELTYIMRI